jgi:DNA-binding CsgD family transcriptional regulator
MLDSNSSLGLSNVSGSQEASSFEDADCAPGISPGTSPDTQSVVTSIPQLSLSHNDFLGTLGLSVSWAWHFAFFFSEVVILPFNPSLRIEPLFRLAGLMGIACGFLLVLLMRRVLRKPSRRTVLFIVLPLIPIPLFILSAYEIQEGVLFYLPSLLGWFASGLTIAFFQLEQLLFMGTIDSASKRSYCHALALIIGAVIYLALIAFSFPLNIIVLACLPAFASVCLYISNHQSHVTNSLLRQSDIPVLKTIRTIGTVEPHRILYGAVFGLSLNVAISVSVDLTGSLSLTTSIAFCLPGLALLFLLLLRHGEINVETTQWVLINLITITFALMPFLSPKFIVYVLSIVGFCFVLFQGIFMITLAELVNEEQEGAITMLSTHMLVISLATLIGWGLGSFLLIFESYEGGFFNFIIATLIVLLIVSVAWQGRPGTAAEAVLHLHRFGDDSMGRWKRACADISESNGLSKRQDEVFRYLVKGRNALSISRELVVSEHTVKAHIYRIYQKLAVHSQQELIDLVEQKIAR